MWNLFHVSQHVAVFLSLLKSWVLLFGSFLMCVSVCVCMCVRTCTLTPWQTFIRENLQQPVLSIMWVLGTELRLSDLTASTLTHWTVLLALFSTPRIAISADEAPGNKWLIFKARAQTQTSGFHIHNSFPSCQWTINEKKRTYPLLQSQHTKGTDENVSRRQAIVAQSWGE